MYACMHLCACLSLPSSLISPLHPSLPPSDTDLLHEYQSLKTRVLQYEQKVEKSEGWGREEGEEEPKD